MGAAFFLPLPFAGDVALPFGQTRNVPSFVVFSTRYELPQLGQGSATGLVAEVKSHLG